jgi:glycosyltransferase involved in cell wall biosynthesis
MQKKIKIAFVKMAGMAAGGTEKFLQIIAANLPKNRFEVDFYYCDAVPYIGAKNEIIPTDPSRIKYMRDHGINLIKFNVQAKDITNPFHKWVGTNFFQVFDESKYDIIQTGRSGHKEYPFYKIKHTPIVDSLHLSSGVDNQFNISRVMHICQWNADKWIKKGGDSARVVLVSHPTQIENKLYENLRSGLGLQGKFIFGFHQRPHDSIFSSIPLDAYKKIENENTAFILMGGGGKYRQQAKELGLKNAYFLPANGDLDEVCKFLSTLNVYAHGRKDGEVNSTAMAEAMYFGLPIVSHFSEINNGHVECIGDAGKVLKTVKEYAEELNKLMSDKEYFQYRSGQAKKRFQEKYELNGQMQNIISIYEDVIKNPFPHKLRRIYYSLHYTQNIRVLLAEIYLFLKYKLGFKFLKRG